MSIFSKHRVSRATSEMSRVAPAWGSRTESTAPWRQPVTTVTVSAEEARQRVKDTVKSAHTELASLVKAEREQMARSIEQKLRQDLERLIRREIATAFDTHEAARAGAAPKQAEKEGSQAEQGDDSGSDDDGAAAEVS